jgi:hypothetical protein
LTFCDGKKNADEVKKEGGNLLRGMLVDESKLQTRFGKCKSRFDPGGWA